MTMKISTLVGLLCCGLLLTACGGDTESSSTNTTAAPLKLMLDKDPGEAKGIFEVRSMKPGEDVVVMGRVQHIEKGFAALRLIDDELEWCGRGDNPMKDNVTPWDYCCVDPKVRENAILPVEVRMDGEVVEAEDPGLRLLDLVVVRGKLEKTEAGGIVLVTNGWFRRDRPEFGDRQIDWP